jgi:hypothetical protein
MFMGNAATTSRGHENHMTIPQSTEPTAAELALVAQAFAMKLHEHDLCELLAFLNGLTNHRFTGIYRFEPGWVVCVALWDRENPSVRIGANVKMKESYCWLTGTHGDGYTIDDAVCDNRLEGHAAREEVRSYVAVTLRDRASQPWGTLCHFDFQPRETAAETLSRLAVFRPLVEEVLVRDRVAQWDPEAPSLGER